ncbi:MAG TPA: hypothetical protein V6C85_22105 [Allocoleopsis sp.]
MGEITREEIRDRMGNIDLIRDIIFGPKLGEYDSRLDKLEAHLSSLEKEIRERTDRAKADCLAELRVSVDSLDEKIKSLGLTTQKDSVDTRQLIERTYSNFTSSLESLDKTVISQTSSIRRELSETRDKLQEDTENLKSEIFGELEKRFSMLKDTKVSRNDMADVLFELGLRLKKAEFAPGLKESSHTNGTDDALLVEATKVSE